MEGSRIGLNGNQTVEPSAIIDVASKWFAGRKIVIASKHGKEHVLQPLLEKQLHLEVIVPNDLDTDILGTFTGEVDRLLDPLSALRRKCEMAMNQYGVDLAIASEGSFGPHPAIFFVQADEELLMLKDLKNNIEIVAREVSTSTNFNAIDTDSIDALIDFANIVGFPEHALMLNGADKSDVEFIKGIQHEELLFQSFNKLRSKFLKVHVQTDMRAMFNPTRMRVIARAAEKLMDKILNCCPNCQFPGFDITQIIRGLPCCNCGAPTNSIQFLRYQCQDCQYQIFKNNPDQKNCEDPMYCDICNP